MDAGARWDERLLREAIRSFEVLGTSAEMVTAGEEGKEKPLDERRLLVSG
jgi:hypothetical protein